MLTRHASLLAVAGLVLPLGCGARTGLLVPEPALDAGPPPVNVTVATTLPPICKSASVPFIYLVTEENELVSYDPTASIGTFTRIGSLACPIEDATATPFSMAVDHAGLAYVVFDDGELFEVSTKTAACTPTDFFTPFSNFDTFGMGFATEPDGSESLYVLSDAAPFALGKIDPTTLALSNVGVVTPAITAAELTGNGAGQLFAFWAPNGADATGSAIGELDTTTGALVSQTLLPTVTQANAWAFAYYAGAFYMFTAAGLSGSAVTRYDPVKASVTVVAQFDGTIVGAGVSTCAPTR